MTPYPSIAHPWIDSSLAPLYRVTFPASTSDDKLNRYCRAVEHWSTRVDFSVGWVMDLSRVSAVPAQQRASFAKYMERMKSFDERWTQVCALVLPNAMLRGVVTAIFWLYRPPFEPRAFADVETALHWARSGLASASSHGLAPDGVSIVPRPPLGS